MTMLTKIIYNCNPESLGDMDASDFVTAFENEVRAKPLYRDLQIEVTFENGRSEATMISSDDERDFSDELYEEFDQFAEKAFAVVCESRCHLRPPVPNIIGA